MRRVNRVVVTIVFIPLFLCTISQAFLHNYYSYLNLQRDIFINEPNGVQYYNDNQYLIVVYNIDGTPKLITQFDKSKINK